MGKKSGKKLQRENITRTRINRFMISIFLFLICSTIITDMIGELFLPHDMPEQPKESFFKGLFGGGSRALDREELCK